MLDLPKLIRRHQNAVAMPSSDEMVPSRVGYGAPDARWMRAPRTRMVTLGKPGSAALWTHSSGPAAPDYRGERGHMMSASIRRVGDAHLNVW